MSKMVGGLGVLTACIAAAIGQPNAYIWTGGNTNLNEPANWRGDASPLEAADLPERTVLGSADGQPLVTSLSDGQVLDVGSTIVFTADTHIILSTGENHFRSSIVLTADTTSRAGIATFDPVPIFPAGNDYGSLSTQPRYDMTCNLNWRSNGAIPLEQPCTDTVVQFPESGNTVVASTYGEAAAFSAITLTNAPSGAPQPRVTACGPHTREYRHRLGTRNLVYLPDCPGRVRFGAAGQSAPCESAPVAGLSSTCGPSANFIAELNGPGTSEHFTLILRGPYAGTLVQADQIISRLINVTGSVNVTLNAGGDAYSLGNVTVNAMTGEVTSNPSYPFASESDGDDSGGGGNTLVIAAVTATVVAAVMVLSAIYIVHGRAKARQSERYDKKTFVAAAAFANPMYADGLDGRTRTGTGTVSLELVPEPDDYLYDYSSESPQRGRSRAPSTDGSLSDGYGFDGGPDEVPNAGPALVASLSTMDVAVGAYAGLDDGDGVV